MTSSRWYLALALLLPLVSVLGCSVLHELQPHRMWQWNRFDAPSLDPEFGFQPAGCDRQV